MFEFAFIHIRSAQLAPYDGRDFERGAVSGTEAVTMRLAEVLVQRGHRASIYNNRSSCDEVNGVTYLPLEETAAIGPATIAISNNSIAALDGLSARRRVIWGHLDLRLARLRKRRELLTVLRVRPHLVVPSRYSARRTHAIIPFRSRTVIEHGVEEAFLKFEPLAEPPAPIAIFASQPKRNLDFVIEAWRRRVHPRLPSARLHVYVPTRDQLPDDRDDWADVGIEIKGSVSKSELAENFRAARVMIYPGHKEETFCNAAAEAIATGLPVVTMDIGALPERVRDGVDGFVANSVEDMGDRALKILTDDAEWARLHRAGIHVSRERSWDVRASEWERAAARW